MTARLCAKHGAILRADCIGCKRAEAYKTRALNLAKWLREINPVHQREPISRRKAKHK